MSAARVGTTTRDQVLGRVRSALAGREGLPHPGALNTDPDGGLDALSSRLRQNGARVERVESGAAPGEWIGHLLQRLVPRDELTVAVGHGVPGRLIPPLPTAPPDQASVGISLAWGAAAETGTLVLPATEGRRVQLLVPVHVVWLDEGHIHARLQDALDSARKRGMGAALGLHSGPSKSADIGRTLVTGVHGPGQLVVAVL
ncbi:MAG: lactate utilization protein [Gemmatimonadota bacterium]|nr:lactate utilization protein [Gemmatimonadota bacterium]